MAKKKFKKDVPPLVRAPVADRSVQLMLAVLLRNRDALDSVSDTLNAAALAEKNPGYGVAWAILLNYVQKHDALPEKEFLLAEIENQLTLNPSQLNEIDQEDLGHFIEFAYDPTSFKRDLSDPEYVTFARKIAQRVLEEQLAADLKSQMHDGSRNLVEDLPTLLVNFHIKSERLASLQFNETQESFPTGWDQDIALNLWGTGIPFINRYMEGQVDPEVYGLMGPYGSCKSTLGYMLHDEAAKYFFAHDGDGDGRRVAVVVSFEDQLKVMRARTLGYMAQIERRSIENMRGSIDNLAKPGTVLPYERVLFSEELRSGQYVRSEYERAVDAIKVLNRNAVFIDLTGNDLQRRGQGMGGLEEIARIAWKICQAKKVKPGHFVIDYVGAMAKRMLTAPDSQYSNDDLRHLIGGAPLLSKNVIATRFGVPVWLLHQLSGEANSFSPTTLADHTHSAEARNFAENLDFCYSVSKPSIDNVALFGCTKQRRQPRRDNSIILIEGGMNRVTANNGLWVLDAGQRQFIRSEDAGRIYNSAMPPQSAAMTNPGVDV